jgi:hypothetical protein
MKYCRAPDLPDIHNRIPLFAAGGISGCPNWQDDFYTLLNDHLPDNWLFINPRRIGDLAGTGDEASFQIEWEHKWLSRSQVVSFWFPEETLCPITLLELGKYMIKYSKDIFVGCHPNYARRFDVIKQLDLERPNVKVMDSVQSLTNEILTFYGYKNGPK